MLKLELSINTALILKYGSLISNHAVSVEFIFPFLIIVLLWWKLIIHYFLDVFYIPSCMSGSRNFKRAKLEDPRNGGIPVAHMGMEKNEYFHELLFYKCISRLINSQHLLWWEMNCTFKGTIITTGHFLNYRKIEGYDKYL